VFDVFKNRAFRIYWTGQAISLVGTWMQAMAQGWVVTSRTSSAAVLGALNIASTLPILLLGLKAGELADRVDKRKLLMATQAVLGLLALGASLLLFSGQLEVWHLFVMAVLVGITMAFEMPVSQAFAPELVEPAHIPRAVGLMQSIFHGSRLVGPALAAVCIDAWGEGSAFLANAVSFLAVIVSLLLIRPRAGAPATPRPKAAGGFRDGIRFVFSSAQLRALWSLQVLMLLFVSPFIIVLMPSYVRHVLEADASAMGQLMSVGGAGSLAGSVLITVLAGTRWRARLWAGIAGLSASLAAMAWVHALPLAAALVAVNSFSISMLMGTVMQTAQQQVPGELRGRVMGLFGMTFTGVLPLSGLLLSALADQVGLPPVMGVCAVLFLAGGAGVLAVMERTLRREISPS
jgi:MFS family permease